MGEPPGGKKVGGAAARPRRPKTRSLRTGFTTGACAAAATAAAIKALVTGRFPQRSAITLPRGERPVFDLAETALGNLSAPGDWRAIGWRAPWARASVIKDAGDDPDVTHGARIVATLRPGRAGSGVVFHAGEGVGLVTKPGLPIPPGEPAINPVPRQMMRAIVIEAAIAAGLPADMEITISAPGGERMAEKTWNPRLGIVGGISILGTTGIVRPFSCSAWIASIHRGIDVARENGALHVAGSTGATSERVAKGLHRLPDYAMLDMGDFVGGMLKYLKNNHGRVIKRLTIAGGFAKMVKLAQGALDLHSGRSQVDFAKLAQMSAGLGGPSGEIENCNTAAEALEMMGRPLAVRVSEAAQEVALDALDGAPIAVEILIVDRAGAPVAQTDLGRR